MTELKIGDAVRLKKDGARAVVTNDFRAPGRKQERIEYRRDDNASVQECWADEVVRIGGAVAASVPVAAAPEPEAPVAEPAAEAPAVEDKPKPRGRGKKAS